jgi:hypothetical protein
VINEHAQQVEGGASVAAHRSYRIDGSANQTLPRYWRIYGRMNYFTDASTQQSYQDISQYYPTPAHGERDTDGRVSPLQSSDDRRSA